MLMIIEAKSVVIKEILLTPGTNQTARLKTSAFRIKIKSPNDKIVAGRVKINKTGLTRTFKTPSTTTSTNAPKIDSTLKPGNR